MQALFGFGKTQQKKEEEEAVEVCICSFLSSQRVAVIRAHRASVPPDELPVSPHPRARRRGSRPSSRL